MSALGSFAKSFAKDTFKTAIDMLKQDITASTTGVLPKQSAIAAENLAAGLIAVGSAYNTSVAITTQTINTNSNRSTYNAAPTNTAPGSVIMAKSMSSAGPTTNPTVVTARARAEQNIRSIDLV